MHRESILGSVQVFQILQWLEWCQKEHLLCDRRYDDVIKWKHFPRYRPFVRGIHRSPVNSPHKGQWRGALMFSLIRAWINGWVNNGEAGDLRRYRAHYDVIVMATPTMVVILNRHLKHQFLTYTCPELVHYRACRCSSTEWCKTTSKDANDCKIRNIFFKVSLL